ncbi:hypothetical protein P0L94_07530 [Microbacter sp. GSS18]|nr:hypothetical protein P0L94_07530 [Microbacter sp. GSS18]
MPAIAVGVSAPAMAASPTGPVIPDLQIVPEASFTCCSGTPMDMQLVLQFTNPSTGTVVPGSRWCVDQIQLDTNNNPIVWVGQFCGEVGGLPVGPVIICDTPECTTSLIARIYREGTTDYQLVAIAGQDLPQGTGCGCSS